MPVTIIIPSLNSPIIDQVITKLRQQSAWSEVSQVLIVGRDEPGLIPQDSTVKLIDTGQPVSAPTARNIGIREAKSDLLIFLDSDCLPQPDWLAQHLHAQAMGHKVVGGGVLPVGTNYWSLSYNLTIFHEFLTTLRPGQRQFLPTLNISVQRNVIDAVGLLDETLARGQDVDWTARMFQEGYPAFFWPDAAVLHQHNRINLQKVWRDCARSGFHMRQIRLQNAAALDAPFWLNYRLFVLLFSPLIATAVTARIIGRQPALFAQNWATWPAIYLTKIAWCWGASRKSYE